MIVYFLENPQKKITNVFFDKINKLDEKLIGKKLTHSFHFKKKFIRDNKNLIFSFCKLSELKKFLKEVKALKINKFSYYMIFNTTKSIITSKIFIIFFAMLFIKNKDLVFFHKKYINSLIPDFLYKIKFDSFFKALVYYIYQFTKNMFLIFNSNLILIAIRKK
jgi:hypothetical protein|tara:strand:+ start:135 stop:623 length:489 start_codon:yes stop_codon:yes gene_type:complete